MKPVVLITFISYVLSQHPDDVRVPPVPEKCFGSTEMLYKNCCVFPPFFTREVAKECNAGMRLVFIDKKNNVTGFRRHAFNCQHWTCVLNKYDLLNRYGDFDDEKYFTHLDLWVSLNPMFGDAMTEAKAYCKNAYRMQLPLPVCEFFEFQGCIRNYVNVDCPVVIPTQKCIEKKAFFRECRNFYHKK